MYDLSLKRKDGEVLELVERVVSPYKFARVNHDCDRGEALTFYPDEIILQPTGQGTQRANAVPILPPTWKWLRENNNDAAWGLLTHYEWMWINNNGVGGEIDINTKVNAEPITAGGNLVAYDLETPTHIRLVTFNYKDTIIGNFFTHPYLFWYPTSVNSGGQVRKTASGIDVYIPLISYAESWLEKSRITPLSQQPTNWTITNVLNQ